MAVFPCKEFTPCIDPASPVANLTAEAGDGPTFLGLSFPWTDPNNPVGGDDPKTPPVYFSNGCLSTCESSFSQQEADLCAQRQQYICSHTPPPPLPPPVFFSSGPQVCNLSCPDGSIFSYHVLPGAFVNVSQAAADEQAAAFACEAGRSAQFCLSGLPNGCLGNPYSSTIEASGGGSGSIIFETAGTLPPGLVYSQTGINDVKIAGTVTGIGTFNFTVSASQAVAGQESFNFVTNGSLPPNLTFAQTAPDTLTISGTIPHVGTFSFQISVALIIAQQRTFTFSLTAGALPPGLNLTQTGPNSALISGTIGSIGNFTFTIRATESNGNFMERTYTVAVIGITNSPPPGTQNSSYSFSFTAAGGTPPYTFFVSSGALPDGLSMDSLGNITGVPTSAATFNFTVQVEDSAP